MCRADTVSSQCPQTPVTWPGFPSQVSALGPGAGSAAKAYKPGQADWGSGVPAPRVRPPFLFCNLGPGPAGFSQIGCVTSPAERHCSESHVLGKPYASEPALKTDDMCPAGRRNTPQRTRGGLLRPLPPSPCAPSSGPPILSLETTGVRLIGERAPNSRKMSQTLNLFC